MASDRKIFVVEDDKDNCDYLVQYIGMWGYDTVGFNDAPEAIHAMEESPPDLVLLNLYLPTKPGLEVLRTMREINSLKNVPVFILSPDGSDEIRIVCMSNGASEFIVKPVQLFDLSLKIQHALEIQDYRLQIESLNEKLNREKQVLQRYFSRDIVEKILSEEFKPEVNGTLVHATLMFFDLRGSTTIAESIGPQKYSKFVSELFSYLMEIVFDNQGSINELLGDGFFASFGCPVHTGQDEFNAVKAACDIRQFINEFNYDKRYPEELKEDIRFGIGMSTGRIFAGNIGSPNLLKFALMGDPVNTAARIQELTKESAYNILMDKATAEKCSEVFTTASLGEYNLRGKRGSVEIFHFA